MANTSSESSENAESEQPAAEDACVDSPRPQAWLPRPQARSGRESTAASSAGGLARISLTLRKPRCCQLCNGRSTDESPLDYATDELFPEVEGRLPWRSYEKAKEEASAVRVPSGRLCLICFNVYRALGILAKVFEGTCRHLSRPPSPKASRPKRQS